MERSFNTAGPNQPQDSYTIDPLTRIDLEEVLTLIHRKEYISVYAPQKTGKTMAMQALCNLLKASGDYIAVYTDLETSHAEQSDMAAVTCFVCERIAEACSHTIGDDMPRTLCAEVKQRHDATTLCLSSYLQELSLALPKPLVLVLDEFDGLPPVGLNAAMRQIRMGFQQRSAGFPQSIVFCGKRNARDGHVLTDNGVIGAPPFNIITMCLRIPDFTPEEIRALYLQHTEETGQEWDEGCFPIVWEATEGQPWLVNALAREVTWNMRENRDRSVRITPEMVYVAQERLIYRRDTHIDILIDKLREPRVKRVIEPILANSDSIDDALIMSDDIQYVIDMGLVKRDRPLRIANGIYREIFLFLIFAAQK